MILRSEVLQVMEKFTHSSIFKALVTVPAGSLPSDDSHGILAPAEKMSLYWETFEEASQENGVQHIDHIWQQSLHMVCLLI